MLLKKNSKILFFGDSITDAKRDRDNISSMGAGYALIATAYCKLHYIDQDLTFINKGISGNRTIDLLNRVDNDCINHLPNVVSILIGVNDAWHKFRHNNPTTPKELEDNLHNTLSRIKDKLDPTIIIMEPFVLDYDEEIIKIKDDLDKFRAIIKNLSTEYDATFIPLNDIFAKNLHLAPPSYWTIDGVHPTPAGHALIANEWLKAIGALNY